MIPRPDFFQPLGWKIPSQKSPPFGDEFQKGGELVVINFGIFYTSPKRGFQKLFSKLQKLQGDEINNGEKFINAS